MEAENVHNNPKSRQMALRGLGEHNGFVAYCARYDAIIAQEIDSKIFDRDTSDYDRRVLVEARALLKGTYSPDKLRESMIAAANTEITRLENSRKQ